MSATTILHESTGGRPTPAATDGQWTVVEPRPGWRGVDWGELIRYRDLFRFLVLRGIKARYAQSALGVGWAVVQPLVSMVVFTIIFGRLVRVDSGGAPYGIFAFVALVPWSFFAGAMSDATNSLLTNAAIISKIYFPRMLLPLTAVTAKLIDLAIAMVMLVVMVAIHGAMPSHWVAALPLLIALMFATALGLGLWMSAMAIHFRDVAYATPFAVQVLMYLSPVVYPASLVPDRFRLLYGLNPMAGVIGGFRSIFLGTEAMPWDMLLAGSITAAVLVTTGALYFRRMERLFADVA